MFGIPTQFLQVAPGNPGLLPFSVVLDTTQTQFLSDHLFPSNIPGEPPAGLLPGIAFLQIAADAAQSRASGYQLTGFSRTHFQNVCFVKPGAPREVKLGLLRLPPSAGNGERESISFSAVLRGIDSRGGEVEFARTEVELAQGDPPETLETPAFPEEVSSLIVVGGEVYRPATFPNKGIMAMMEAMSLFPPDRALLYFNADAVATVDPEHRYALLSALPLPLDLFFQGANFFTMLSDVDWDAASDEPLPGIYSPNEVRSIKYFGMLQAEDLASLGVVLKRQGDGTFNASIMNLESGALFATIEGFQTVLWKPWEKRPPAPSVAQFFGRAPM